MWETIGWWIIGGMVFCWLVALTLCRAAAKSGRGNEAAMSDNSRVGTWRLQHEALQGIPGSRVILTRIAELEELLGDREEDLTFEYNEHMLASDEVKRLRERVQELQYDLYDFARHIETQAALIHRLQTALRPGDLRVWMDEDGAPQPVVCTETVADLAAAARSTADGKG
jgi:hypothetical protein